MYNSEKTIRRCLNSIFVQKMENIKVIIINDGSTKRSLSLCSDYLKYNNLKIINQKNTGPSTVRNIDLKKLIF